MNTNKVIIKFLCSVSFSTFIALIFVLAIMHFSPVSSILFSHSQYVPTKSFSYLDGYETYLVERMIREKSIISVDDLWTMQVSFHQTIISLLIALNAAILGIAFFVIRSSSKEEVVKASIEQFDQFACSATFTKLVQKKSKKEISKINITYGDLFDQLEALDKRINENDDAIIKISSRIADLDSSEECGDGSLQITE